MTLVLVVEDNEMNADVLARRLQRKGFAICHACDGQEALNKAAELKPDIILMDISLPVMDGYEATSLLKSGVLRDTPVIALTAHALVEERDKAYASGCDEYETKPVNFPRLLEKIARLV